MIYKKLIYTAILLATLALQGCKWVDYHPYDAHVSGEKGVNRKNIERIEAECSGKETIRFVLMGDTQRWYDETEDMVKHINQRDDIDFVIHGGDISDFGMTKEFEWVHRIMSKLKAPYVALIGNHDIIGNGMEVYKAKYGELNFSFIAGNVKFLCLNTNALEFDHSQDVPDYGFIRGELHNADNETYTQTVVAMHSPPESEQFDNNTKEYFQETIKKFRDLRFCLHAHNHRLEERDIFDDGIVYYGCTNIKHRCYVIFTITPESHNYEIVHF